MPPWGQATLPNVQNLAVDCLDLISVVRTTDPRRFAGSSHSPSLQELLLRGVVGRSSSYCAMGTPSKRGPLKCWEGKVAELEACFDPLLPAVPGDHETAGSSQNNVTAQYERIDVIWDGPSTKGNSFVLIPNSAVPGSVRHKVSDSTVEVRLQICSHQSSGPGQTFAPPLDARPSSGGASV